jgi:L,D-peptidoglycan transpeptidase YkuD (ErfK/YbiS/YcfS/YnhG family)
MITYKSRAVLLVVSLLLTGCGGALTTPDHKHAAPRHPTGTSVPGIAHEVIPQGPPAPRASRRLPGLGPETWAKVPSAARQAVVVTGRGRNSPRSSVVLYERTDAGWEASTGWPAHNALRGWTDHHRAGDLRSPIGVFTLTDAGGFLGDPGTRLPYDHAVGFTATGTGFEGESLAGSFDYVIAINYNREPGTSPLDHTRPLGEDRGGGIWIHVDHGGPTQGCVSLPEDRMKELLRTLDPAMNPVIVMGDVTALGR